MHDPWSEVRIEARSDMMQTPPDDGGTATGTVGTAGTALGQPGPGQDARQGDETPTPTPILRVRSGLGASASASARGAVLPVDEAAGVIDEVQAWFLTRADREGWVYTSVLRQLVNGLYRDRDYLDRRSREGRKTAYDFAVERDLKATSWAIRALVRYVPLEEKRTPEPPKPARALRRRLSAVEKERAHGRPSWNGQPKRGWEGPDLPPSAH